MEAERAAAQAFRLLGLREEARGAGCGGAPLALSRGAPSPVLRWEQEVVVGLGWDAVWEGKAVGHSVHVRPLLTVPLWSTPSACTCVTLACGRRVGTKSQGGISSEKRCFPEYPNLALSSPEILWGPRDSVPLGCNPSMLLAQKYPAPSRLPLCPAGDGEPAVRRAD